VQREPKTAAVPRIIGKALGALKKVSAGASPGSSAARANRKSTKSATKGKKGAWTPMLTGKFKKEARQAETQKEQSPSSIRRQAGFENKRPTRASALKHRRARGRA